jgi:hypothetical protein
MYQVTISLSDDLAQRARAVGLLSATAIQELVEKAVCRGEPFAATERMAAADEPAPKEDVGKRLRALWARTPVDEITPEIEQMIVDEVHAVRAEQRRRNMR